ncbi:hypothetical protein [Runella slithyformis]|nr:hypothetical protein [Runella slithyformis]
MTTKQIHYVSGLILSLFVGLHLFNHLCSLVGAERHIAVMNTLRLGYRNSVIEALLLGAVAVQIGSGLRLFRIHRKTAVTPFQKLHVWTGLYLAIFFVIHVSAVLIGRGVLHLDTNFYFGVAGLNSFPFNLFFIPYYGLAVISFFGHVAAIHRQKMKAPLVGVSPNSQAIFLLVFSVVLTLVLMYGLTDHFHGVTIPSEYNILIGK